MVNIGQWGVPMKYAYSNAIKQPRIQQSISPAEAAHVPFSAEGGEGQNL